MFFETFAWLTSSMLLSLERANTEVLLFARLIATLRFLPKSFYFFFNHIARYAQSKESRNLSSKIPQITCKAIFRSCLYFFCNIAYLKQFLEVALIP